MGASKYWVFGSFKMHLFDSHLLEVITAPACKGSQKVVVATEANHNADKNRPRTPDNNQHMGIGTERPHGHFDRAPTNETTLHTRS